MAVIGIDFGTSYTYIFGATAKGNIITLPANSDEFYAVDNSWGEYKGIPSAIGQTIEGEWKVGQAVYDNNLKPQNYVVDMKSLLRAAISDSKINGDGQLKGNDCDESYGKTINGTYYFCLELIKQYFRILFNSDTGFNFPYDKVDKIYIGVPASQENDGHESYSSVLKREVFEPLLSEEESRFGKKNVNGGIKIVPRAEPIFAARAYLDTNIIKENHKLLVLDLGGGTSDFVFVKKENGKLIPLNNSRGADVPSGKGIELDFCNAICADLLEQYDIELEPASFRDEHMQELMEIKEHFFIPKNSALVSKWAEHLNMSIDDVYAEYKDHGKWKIICYNSHNGEPISIKVTHSIGDCTWEESVGTIEEKECDIKVELRRAFDYSKKWFVEDIKKVISQLDEGNGGAVWANLDAVIFVGGTSCIEELCDYILKELGLISCSDDETYYKYNNSGNKIKVITPQDIRRLDAVENGIILTYANAVAYGAVKAALNEDTLGDVPDVWITFDKQHNQADIQLLSKSIKDNNNNVTGCAQNARALYFPVEHLLEVKKQGNPTGKLKLRFWILNQKHEGEKNPTLPPFSITFDKEKDEIQRAPGHYGVLFVADQIDGEAIVYAVKLKDTTNVSAQVFSAYKFTDYNGKKYDVEMADGDDSLDGKLANKDVFRKYIVGWSESTEDAKTVKDKSSKRKRSACSPVNEQVYGWELNNIKTKKIETKK